MLDFGRHVMFQRNNWDTIKDVQSRHGTTAVQWARSTKMDEAVQQKNKMRRIKERRKQTTLLLEAAELEKDEGERKIQITRHKATMKEVEGEYRKAEETLLNLVTSNVLSLGKAKVSCKLYSGPKKRGKMSCFYFIKVYNARCSSPVNRQGHYILHK